MKEDSTVNIENISKLEKQKQKKLKKAWSKLNRPQQLYLNELIRGGNRTQAAKAAGYTREPRGKPLADAIKLLADLNFQTSMDIRQEKIDGYRKISNRLLEMFETTTITVNGEMKAADLLRYVVLFNQMEDKLLGIDKPQETEEQEGLTDDQSDDLSNNINDSCPD